MGRKLRTAVALAAAPLFAVGFASNAMATPQLELSSGGGPPATGVLSSCGSETCVTFNGIVGAWTVNLTGGDSTGPGNPTMDLSSLNATASSSAAPLHIELTDNDFSVGSSFFSLVSSGNLVSGTGTATYSAYFDTGNTDFMETTLIGTLGPFSASYLASMTGPGTTGTPYSLTEDLVLTVDPSGSGVKWSTDSSIAPVPEPASLVLLTSQLVGLGWLGRRRRKAA